MVPHNVADFQAIITTLHHEVASAATPDQLLHTMLRAFSEGTFKGMSEFCGKHPDLNLDDFSKDILQQVKGIEQFFARAFAGPQTGVSGAAYL